MSGLLFKRYLLVIPTYFLALLSSLLLSSCAVTPQVEQLSQEKQDLEKQLQASEMQIAALENEQAILAKDNIELKRVMAILDTEKTSRTTESANVRLQVRRFIQTQMDSLRDFLVQSDLLDYVGETLFERTLLDAEPTTFVDFANPMPSNGTLVGVHGVFTQSSNLVVNIMRPLDDRYLVIWKSQVLKIEKLGSLRVRFPVSIGIEKGDVVAYEFPGAVGVKYDQGTGAAMISRKSLLLGAPLEVSSLKMAEEKRAYSIGALAILE